METFGLYELWQYKYVISLAITALVLYLFNKRQESNKPALNLPPGPRGLPFIGYWQILCRHPYEEIHRLGAKYGKIFMITIGKYKYVVLNDYEILKDVFFKQGDVLTDRPSGFNNIQYIFDHQGIFMESGEKYKELRNFFVNSMKEFGVGYLNSEVALAKQSELSEMAVEYVKSLNGKPIDPMHLFGCMTNNIILKFAMDKEYSYDDEELARIMYLAVHVDSYSDKLWISDYIPWLSNFKSLFEATPTLRREKEEMYAFFRRNVEEHQRTFNEHNIRDYFDCFLNKAKRRQAKNPGVEDPVFNVRQLIASMAIILIGSNISVPVTLSLLMKMFTTEPEVQRKVREEVDRVIGSDRTPTLNDQRNMPYTEAAISEALRIGDVTPLGTPRSPTETLTINGYDIPAGSIVVANYSKVHFDPALWKYPKTYNPDNFLDDDGNFVNHEHFLPFGAGRRICPGLALGKIEMFLITTFLVQSFTFRTPNATEILEEKARYSQHVPPFQIIAERRV